MGSAKPFKYQPQSFTKLLPWTLFVLIPTAILHLHLYPIPSFLTLYNQLQTSPPPSPPPPPPSQEAQSSSVQIACDYANGKWVRDKIGPLYNGTTCGTIKPGQNCMSNGRPNMGYLYWRWKPKQCTIPRFEPETFLQSVRNKNMAFVGDSVARNQLESLICMLATVSSPDLVYKDGEDENFRRWHFPSHNVNISLYWSPFLVKGIEQSDNGERNYNSLYLDSVDERWAMDINHLDMIVFSVGHWFVKPAVFYHGDSVLGCHYCSGQNYTEIGFYDIYKKAFEIALNTIIERRGPSGNGVDVIVSTFAPAHFEGEWYKFGACPKIKPYKPREKQLEGMDEEMRKIEIEEVMAAKTKAKQFGNIRLEAMDVTKLSLLRPDGHPGPYWHPFPFKNGIPEHVPNDCLHWCLPGPIDTWNEILLDVMKRWEGESKKEL